MGNVTDIGWSFPPHFEKPTGEVAGGVTMTTGEADIRGSLSVLFSTRKGDRLFRPDFGASLEDFLFKPMDTEATLRLTEMISAVVRRYEPRIFVRDIDISDSDTLGGTLRVVLKYIIRDDRSGNAPVETFTFEIN